MQYFNTNHVDYSWIPLLERALSKVSPAYLHVLEKNNKWLPGKKRIFNAFSLPLQKTHYILFGESPYPREASANGYAFWDNAVKEIWSTTGFSRAVNRATSLRNFIKMLLVADGKLKPSNLSQQAIAAIEKQSYIVELDQLFGNILSHGFLLLNASLALSDMPVSKEAHAWIPFMDDLLKQLHQQNPNITLILFGRIAKNIDKLPATTLYSKFCVEHPYNLSFITNPTILKFFKPFNLLQK